MMEEQLKEKLVELEAELADAKIALQTKDQELEQLREKAKEATSNARDIAKGTVGGGERSKEGAGQLAST